MLGFQFNLKLVQGLGFEFNELGLVTLKTSYPTNLSPNQFLVKPSLVSHRVNPG